MMGILSHLCRLFRKPAPAATVPPAVAAYRESLARLHAEREAELRAELAAESPESRRIAAQIADMTPTQQDRALGRESVIPLRPTHFARRLRTLR